MIFMARTLSVFILVVLFNLPALADSLHIRVFNVGEGQAVLLQRGEHAVLVDTGHAGQTGSIIKRMHALGIHTLDYLFLTHLHPDHASGLFRVQERAVPLSEVAGSPVEGWSCGRPAVGWHRAPIRTKQEPRRCPPQRARGG